MSVVELNQARKPRWRYIPDLLVHHYEELEFLWGQRRVALCSPRYFLRDFLHLNERIEAHLQGLLTVPEALPDLLLPKLEQPDGRDSVFAAACPLLRLGYPAFNQKVFAYFGLNDLTVVAGIRDAASFASASSSIDFLQQILHHGPDLQAAYAGTALSNLGVLSPHPRLNQLMQHEMPVVAKAAWQASVGLDCKQPPEHVRPYQAAIAGGDDQVRDAAFYSAAWTRQAWLLTWLQQLSLSGDQQALKWLAIIGGVKDGNLLVTQAELIADPEAHCELLVRFGHPGVLPVLRKLMDSPDPLLSSIAGSTFTRVTAFDVRGERVEAPVSETADEFEREFVALIWSSDTSKADAYLRQNAGQLQQSSRLSQGLALDGVVSSQILDKLDLQMRWDQLARHRWSGGNNLLTQPIL